MFLVVVSEHMYTLCSYTKGDVLYYPCAVVLLLKVVGIAVQLMATVQWCHLGTVEVQ